MSCSIFLCIFLISFLGYLLYKYLIYPLKYWKRKNVQQTSPLPLVGDLLPVLIGIRTPVAHFNEIYKKINGRYFGQYQMSTPILSIIDPELIKQVVIKDFDHFTDHQTFFPDDIDPLWSRMLLSLKGEKWRDMRGTMSPAFTGSKMRAMFVLLNECAENCVNFLKEKNENIIELEFKEMFSRFATNAIASCAFGIEIDSFKEPKNEFFIRGKSAVDPKSFKVNFKFLLYFVAPKLARFMGFSLFGQETREYFHQIVMQNIKTREEKNLYRPDMINLLMEAKKGSLKHDEDIQKDDGYAVIEESHVGKTLKKNKTEISDLDMTANAFVFFLAGFDTVTTAMGFMAYELAVNQEIQIKLTEEIDSVRKSCNNKPTYELIANMKYLDLVITETLRKWPGLLGTDRVCTKPYTIEPITPNESPISLNIGDVIIIPIISLHYDPKYYPNPEKFDPERFRKTENKSNPYFPFGVGPRSCIGNRFAIMEMKTMYYHLLSNFEIVPIKRSVIPIKLSNSMINVTPADGFWYGLKKRELSASN